MFDNGIRRCKSPNFRLHQLFFLVIRNFQQSRLFQQIHVAGIAFRPISLREWSHSNNRPLDIPPTQSINKELSIKTYQANNNNKFHEPIVAESFKISSKLERRAIGQRTINKSGYDSLGWPALKYYFGKTLMWIRNIFFNNPAVPLETARQKNLFLNRKPLDFLVEFAS